MEFLGQSFDILLILLMRLRVFEQSIGQLLSSCLVEQRIDFLIHNVSTNGLDKVVARTANFSF